MRSIVLFYVTFGLMSFVYGHEKMFGSCPKIKPMEDLDMKKMEGLWYVQESFDNHEKCVTWNFSDNGDFIWSIKEKKNSGFLHSTNLDSNSMTTAKLYPKGDIGKFTVNWPINFGGDYYFTIYYSDYENVAGVFSCQEMLFGHRQEGTVLSRVPNPPKRFVQRARGKLYNYGIMMAYFKTVDHSKCGYYDNDEVVYDKGPLSNGKSVIKDDDHEDIFPIFPSFYDQYFQIF